MPVDINGADAAMRPLGMTGTVFPREDCATCRRRETCSACRRAAQREAAPEEPVSPASEAAVRRRRMRWAVMAAAAGTVSLILPLCWEYLPDVLAWLGDPARVRAFVAEHAIASRLVLFSINFIQVLLAFLPGEPVELASGYAFGFWEGTAMCLVASGAATCVIWWAVRRWGWHLIDLFFDRSLVERFSWLQNSRRMGLVMLCVFLVPGTPKDFLTYFAGLDQHGLCSRGAYRHVWADPLDRHLDRCRLGTGGGRGGAGCCSRGGVGAHAGCGWMLGARGTQARCESVLAERDANGKQTVILPAVYGLLAIGRYSVG